MTTAQEISRTLNQVADALRALGQTVEISIHPSQYGCSGYIRTSKGNGRVAISTGARISDHMVGESRRGTDGLAYFCEDVAAAEVIGALTISDDLVVAAAEKAAANADARLIKAREN